MVSFLIVLHIVVCVFLIIAILMQSSKGGGLAGVFGGGGGGMGGVFGGRGAASFLAKVTLWLGIGFGVTSLAIGLLSLKSGSRPKSLIQQALEKEKAAASPASALPTISSRTGNPADLVPKGVPEKPKSN